MMNNRLQPFLVAILMSGAASLGLSSLSFGDEHTGETDEQPAEEFYLHGFIEVGGLVFIDRPPVEDRAKFEEYGETSPGFIVPEVYIEFGTADGLRFVEIHGTNLTWNDRNVVVELSKPGSHYLMFGWDETPHVYSTSAQTLHSGPANDLVVDDGVQTFLDGAPNTGAGSREEFLNDPANLRRTELSVDRKTASAELRLTPSPQWDIRLNYSHEKRDGTKPFRGNLGFGDIVEFPEPVDYTTQTIGASAQYFGKLAEGRTWTANLAYSGSFFENEFESVAWDNPFDDPLVAGGNERGRHALAPDNYAHAITLSGGIDLSKNTRFTGTVAYNMMRQDEDFIPMTINPALLPGPALPATSLNGEIDTLTVDSKLTTKLHPDVQATAKYRYYSSDNDTPELYFAEYIRTDSSLRTGPGQAERTSLSRSYTKQNADLDFVWDAHDMATLGLLLGWEQYDRDRRAVDVTNEFSGKVTADLEPADWLSMRASALYAQRRFDNYDYTTFVGDVTHTPGNGDENPLTRKYDLADRDRLQLNLSAEASLSEGLTITVLGGVRNDEFEDNFLGGEFGLLHDRSWDAGLELYYMADETISFFASYTHERIDRRIRNTSWTQDVDDEVDTVMAGINWAIIPDTLDLTVDGTYSWAVEKVPAGIGTATAFPDVTNDYQRYEASLKYTFDEDQKQRFGWTGDAIATLGYAYERNDMTNWGDLAVPYSSPAANNSIFLADQNPNYEAQIVYGTLKLEW